MDSTNSFDSYLTLLDSWTKYFGLTAYSGGVLSSDESSCFDKLYHKKSTEITKFGNVDTYAEEKFISTFIQNHGKLQPIKIELLGRLCFIYYYVNIGIIIKYFD